MIDATVTETAENYAQLSTAERWDYCWDVDLAQDNWVARCRTTLDGGVYLRDLEGFLEAEAEADAEHAARASEEVSQ